MPDIVVHNSMGKEVFDNLGYEISSHLNYDIFRFGVMAPDVYYYYRYFALSLRHNINRKSSVLHNVHTGDLLVALAKRARSEEMFSFLSGVLCHYALDGAVHPCIHEVEQTSGCTHTEIEKKLDQIELLKQGKKIAERPVSNELLPPYLPEKMKTALDDVYKEIYGWNDTWKLMRTSYRHMKQFVWIIEDPLGMLCLVIAKNPLKHLHPKLSGLSYRGNYSDNNDFSWFSNEKDKAVRAALVYINSCYEFINGRMSEIDLRKVIGNKSYVTGEEITEYGLASEA